MTMIKAKLKKSWFNELYFEIDRLISDPNIRIITVRGGSSAAKSFSIAQAILGNCLENDCSAMILRAEQSGMDVSIYKTFEAAAETMRYTELVTNQKLRMRLFNGRELVYKGLDKSSKKKGIEGFQIFFIDEVDQIKESDFFEMLRRLRGKPNLKLIVAFNPISIEHWLKKFLDEFQWTEYKPNNHSEFRDTDFERCGSHVSIRTTYLDNKFIVGPHYYDEETIKNFQLLKKINPNDYEVYAKGLWGHTKPESQYVYNFNSKKHVKTGVELVQGKSIHIWLDFNIGYMAALQVQFDIREGWLRVSRAFKPYKNCDMRTRISEFEATYEGKKHLLVITGDPSKGRTARDSSSDYYTDMIGGLKISPHQIVVPKAHLINTQYRRLLNTFFAIFPNIEIDASCEELISDLIYCQTIGTSDDLDKRQPHRTHYLDAFKYGLQAFFLNIINGYGNKKN